MLSQVQSARKGRNRVGCMLWLDSRNPDGIHLGALENKESFPLLLCCCQVHFFEFTESVTPLKDELCPKFTLTEQHCQSPTAGKHYPRLLLYLFAVILCACMYEPQSTTTSLTTKSTTILPACYSWLSEHHLLPWSQRISFNFPHWFLQCIIQQETEDWSKSQIFMNTVYLCDVTCGNSEERNNFCPLNTGIEARF